MKVFIVIPERNFTFFFGGYLIKAVFKTVE